MQNRRQQIYYVWAAMRQRCRNPNNQAYKNYGERGINICEHWDSFENFVEDMGIPPKGWTIERINNDEGYSLPNCVWSTRMGQTRNRRNTNLYEIDGKKMTLKECANEKSLNYHSLRTRLGKGLPLSDILYEGKFPNNNIYGKDKNGRFIKKDFHGRLCAIEERNKKIN